MSKTDNKKGATLDANEDPLTGAPGAHPVGVAVGATGGAAAGAAVGAVGGPVGVAVGAAVGGLAGGLAGKGAAEAINPTIEEAYWRDTYVERPYVETGRHYDYYRPGVPLRLGVVLAVRAPQLRRDGGDAVARVGRAPRRLEADVERGAGGRARRLEPRVRPARPYGGRRHA